MHKICTHFFPWKIGIIDSLHNQHYSQSSRKLRLICITWLSWVHNYITTWGKYNQSVIYWESSFNAVFSMIWLVDFKGFCLNIGMTSIHIEHSRCGSIWHHTHAYHCCIPTIFVLSKDANGPTGFLQRSGHPKIHSSDQKPHTNNQSVRQSIG